MGATLYLTRPFLDVIELSFKCRKAGMNAVPGLGNEGFMFQSPMQSSKTDGLIACFQVGGI